MANYNNANYTYAQVLAGTGYYMMDDQLRYSAGVEEMQAKLNLASYNCGTSDGKFGQSTDTAVRSFQIGNGLTMDGKAGKDTLTKLDAVILSKYGVNFNTSTKKFDTNQQTVYTILKNAGLRDLAIAGIMGNIQAESGFSITIPSTGAGGICQWQGERLNKLKAYIAANGGNSISVQANFILAECDSSQPSYYDSTSAGALAALKDSNTVKTAKAAADHFTARFERCQNYATWSEVESACETVSYLTLDRFMKDANAYNGKFYIDTPKRRGYAEAYYQCMQKM